MGDQQQGKAGRPGAPSPAGIMQLATGYWPSMVLLTLNELRVFTVLGGGGGTVDEVAGELGLDARALRYLLDGALNLGLVRLDGERYHNSPETDFFLVEGKPSFMGGGLKYALDSYPVWGRLPDAIRTGHAQMGSREYLGEDAERTRRYVYAMLHRSKPTAMGLGQGIDLAGCTRLLDVGGGAGVFSMIFCGKHPELRATLMDLPGVLKVAAEIIAAEGLSERIDLVEGDFHEDVLGDAAYDAVFLNGILHRELPDFCRDLIGRAARALVPGGQVHICDVMLDDTGHGPLFGALFGLNMLLTAEGGGTHPTADQARWLEEAGFVDVRSMALPAPSTHSVVSGRLPR